MTPASGPETTATEGLVETVRSQTVAADGTGLLVAGSTASNIDVSKQLSD